MKQLMMEVTNEKKKGTPTQEKKQKKRASVAPKYPTLAQKFKGPVREANKVFDREFVVYSKEQTIKFNRKREAALHRERKLAARKRVSVVKVVEPAICCEGDDVLCAKCLGAIS